MLGVAVALLSVEVVGRVCIEGTVHLLPTVALLVLLIKLKE